MENKWFFPFFVAQGSDDHNRILSSRLFLRKVGRFGHRCEVVMFTGVDDLIRTAAGDLVHALAPEVS